MIEVTKDKGVTIVQMVDSDRANALTGTMKAALLPAVRSFFDDADQRCLILTGQDRFFCAGGDLATLRDGQGAGDTRERLASTHELVRLLMLGEKPVITAVNGVAAGGGFGLAMLGDIILASDKARFRPAFPAIGVAADVGLAMTLPNAVGTVRARDILLNDRSVDAEEALRIGMISQVHPDAELMEQAVKTAKRLANGPTLALGLTKQLIQASRDLSADAFLNAEFAAQAVTFGSADCREGVAAFYEKRAPLFNGR